MEITNDISFEFGDNECYRFVKLLSEKYEMCKLGEDRIAFEEADFDDLLSGAAVDIIEMEISGNGSTLKDVVEVFDKKDIRDTEKMMIFFLLSQEVFDMGNMLETTSALQEKLPKATNIIWGAGTSENVDFARVVLICAMRNNV